MTNKKSFSKNGLSHLESQIIQADSIEAIKTFPVAALT